MREHAEIVTLSDEIDYLRSYMDIQRYRYADRFTFMLRVSDEPLPVRLPRFCLLPLVENVFTHAIPYTTRVVAIRVTASVVARGGSGALKIVVRDDGPGCSEERWNEINTSLAELRSMETHGIGLHSVLLPRSPSACSRQETSASVPLSR